MTDPYNTFAAAERLRGAPALITQCARLEITKPMDPGLAPNKDETCSEQIIHSLAESSGHHTHGDYGMEFHHGRILLFRWCEML